MSQNKNWKEDFDSRFNPRNSVPSEIRILAKAFLCDIKSFIEEVISQRENEIAEEVEKVSFEDSFDGQLNANIYRIAFTDDVLKILKH